MTAEITVIILCAAIIAISVNIVLHSALVSIREELRWQHRRLVNLELRFMQPVDLPMDAADDALPTDHRT